MWLVSFTANAVAGKRLFKNSPHEVTRRLGVGRPPPRPTNSADFRITAWGGRAGMLTGSWQRPEAKGLANSPQLSKPAARRTRTRVSQPAVWLGLRTQRKPRACRAEATFHPAPHEQQRGGDLGGDAGEESRRAYAPHQAYPIPSPPWGRRGVREERCTRNEAQSRRRPLTSAPGLHWSRLRLRNRNPTSGRLLQEEAPDAVFWLA